MKRSILGWSVAIVTLVVGLACLQVWLHLQIISLGYEISRESKVHERLLQMRAQYTLELRSRRDLVRIERIAREELHMVIPDPENITVLRMKEGDRVE